MPIVYKENHVPACVTYILPINQTKFTHPSLQSQRHLLQAFTTQSTRTMQLLYLLLLSLLSLLGHANPLTPRQAACATTTLTLPPSTITLTLPPTTLTLPPTTKTTTLTLPPSTTTSLITVFRPPVIVTVTATKTVTKKCHWEGKAECCRSWQSDWLRAALIQRVSAYGLRYCYWMYYYFKRARQGAGA